MKQKNIKGNITVFDNYESQKTTAYSNDLADFLGGKEALDKINIYGNRIIYCMMEMLKTVQIFKPKYQDVKNIILDEMVVDLEKGIITTRRELTEIEVQERRILEAGKKLAIIENSYFLDNYSMLQFVIPTKALNDNGNIKVSSNELFREQLEIFKILGLHYINSNDNKKSMITNFIEHPQFDKGSSFISFYISKTTANMLLNNVNGYSNVHRTIVFNNSSHLPLTIYLFLNRKFGKMNGGTIKIEKFISETNIAAHYKKPSLLKPFLTTIKEALNKTGNKSFGFSIKLDKTIDFVLYDTPNIIGIELKDEDKYKCSNALKYIIKKRKVSVEQADMIKKLFAKNGYLQMSKITTISNSKELIGDDYYKWFLIKCSENDLL